MNKLKTIIKIAFCNLQVHKIRSVFTVAGVVIGIATVTVVMSAGAGLREFVVRQIQNFGTNTMFVEARPPDTVAFTIITTLKIDQVEEVRSNRKMFPHVTHAYTYLGDQGIAVSRYEEITIDIMGTNEDFINVDASKVAEGRFFTEKEEKSLKKVAVLGYRAAQKLFPAGNALGNNLKLGNLSLTIIGVMAEKGPDLMMNMDNMVFIPLELMRKTITGVDYIMFFAVQVENKKYYAETKEQISQYLRTAHRLKPENKDDFAITTSEEAVEMLDIVFVGLSFLLLSIAFISLLVGGIGIMNIMYVSVTERIREIGIRKAVGAKYSDILNQFLMEAVLVTILGGIIGVGVGISITYLIAYISQAYGFNWPFVISTNAIVVSVLVAAFFGIVFGLAPARKAAKQDPITALRYE